VAGVTPEIELELAGKWPTRRRSEPERAGAAHENEIEVAGKRPQARTKQVHNRRFAAN